MDNQTEIEATVSGKTRHPGKAARIAACLISILLTLFLISIIFFGSGLVKSASAGSVISYDIIRRFDNFITNSTSSALEGLVVIDKIYMLSDNVQVAPAPKQSNFGETDDPSEIQHLLDDAADILDGQELLFDVETPLLKDSVVHYYLDETMLSITWKENINNVVYTISEVKIAHPTQFRRFLADGEFGSEKQYLTSEMASSVNAVVASAGDFYKYRPEGLVVYNGEVKRFMGTNLDICFIDDKGDLIFSHAGEITDLESAQKFVADNNIRFSLSFGPILVENGVRCEPRKYDLGEIDHPFPRAAICQLDELHYVLVAVNGEGAHYNFPTLSSFAEVLEGKGIDKAYTLDGGQTATIVMNNEVINKVNYGSERYISDIIYFATAIPNKEK